MYIIGVLLMCAVSFLTGPLAIINSFQSGRIALAVTQIIIVLLFMAVAIIIFCIREHCNDFELDYDDNDSEAARSLKCAGGYTFAFAVMLTLAMWFLSLGGIM